ncbi:hypothetical protein TSAR_005337 [Trichomalopsis sarcophagae]|uniref:Peptidase M12B domain-containing protein n=1 Tax=Trichomalopsis sarcophagae TaxID=543379 RepID=A0A232FEV2_9HYME|nr:hypothetical protein TSAR_005337 [Trichomalopsis sarcophagae]
MFLLFLSFVILAVSSHGSKIHEQMTAEEVHSIFRTTHDEVPEYEVVPIAHAIHENSPKDSIHRILQIKSFKRDMRLYLEPTEGILAASDLPMWTAEGDEDSPWGIKYTKISKGMKERMYFYQDPYNLAAFTSTHDEHGEILFDGTIGDDFVVRPLPARLRKVFSRAKRSIHEEDFPQFNRTVYHPNLKDTYHHVIYKKKEVSFDGIREKIGSYVLKNKTESESSRTKRSTKKTYNPKIVYPQILVIVDYNEYFRSLHNFAEVKRYIISFWNAVDLRYRVFVNPEVRLNIAGIIVATDPDGTPYTQNHRTRPVDGPIIDADKALDNMAEYFFEELMNKDLDRFAIDRDYDMVMLMTQLDLCNLEPNDHDFDCTTLGYAVRGGACTVNIRETKMEAVGLVEDNGGYVGIIPAAHEVGHLLGAPHDGHEQEDKTTCPAYGGYIMTGMLMLTKNVFMWSSCSMEYFEDFFHSQRAQCLVDTPRKVKASPRHLPGQILSVDEQCDRIKGTYACNKDETACVHLDCFVPDSGGQCLPVAPAAEGSSCGKGRYCINGQCVRRNTSEVLLQFAPPPEEERPYSNNIGVDVGLNIPFNIERN